MEENKILKIIKRNYSGKNFRILLKRSQKKKLKAFKKKRIPSYISNTSVYNIFAGMKQRCGNKKNKDYEYYGGRGICVAWASYKDFEKDMLSSYFKGASIERIDNNADYSKNNCKWINKKMQPRNRRPASEWHFKSKSYPQLQIK